MSQGFSTRDEIAAGSVLAAAREDLNLSVTDVARHLKLSPAQVEALEKGAYERLPGRVFVRGFLRNYARLLSIDPQPLLRSIEAQMPHATIAEERPRSPQVFMPREKPARWPLYAALSAVVIVGALAVYEFGFNEAPMSAQDGSTSAAGTGAVDSGAAEPSTLQPLAPGAVPLPASSVSSSPQVSTMTGAASATGAGAKASAGQADLVSSTSVAGEQQASVARTGERELYFRFDEESWVEIRDRNDKVIFSRLNRAGSEERISGVPPLKLVVGNARGVRLNFDERPFDLAPHTGVSVARFTLE